ncbi:MAG: dTDP-4-dehydrorhamnose 3,5-epimerase [Anaerolineales bacterium]
MIFIETNLKGAYIIDLEKREDDRGFFARTWDGRIFEEQGLIGKAAQQSVSFNKARGTIRGVHYRKAPYQETRLIRCTRGEIFDVIVDLRPESHTFKQWLGMELTMDNYRMLYVPKDFAHGFQTLQNDTEVTYLMSEIHVPEAEAGFRYNDPAIGIEWPLSVTMISKRDVNYADYSMDPLN